jgi:WD40 repeat protein
LWATSAADETIRLWDTEKGKEKAVLPARLSKFFPYQLAFSADSRFLAGAGDRLEIWPASGTQGKARITTGRRGYNRDIAFSKDGRRIAALARDGRVNIWDAVSGHLLITLPGQDHGFVCLAWSPDGKYIAAGNTMGLGKPGSQVRVWASDTGRPMRSLTGFLARSIALPSARTASGWRRGAAT